jgi:phage terminase large subunit
MQANLTVSPKQAEFIHSLEDYVLFCGGLGSGKTHAGALWAIVMALKYPNVKGLITANSYSQLKKATLPKVFELLTELGIPFNYKSQDGILTIEDTVIYCISMEKYDLLRGIEVGWAWSDECAFYRDEAFLVLIGRIRDKRGPCQWKGTTTPNGFNWLYKRFVEKPFKSARVIYSKTSENLRNLKEGYYDDLQQQYDSKLSAQELDGQFINLTSGKVYHAFDRRAHVVSTNRWREDIYTGLDFNVHPLCGAYVFIRNGIIYVTKELYLEHSNTFDAAKRIRKDWPGEYVNIVPDETGNRRQTSSHTSDHEILRRAGLSVLYFKNPRERDRQNNINRLLEHGLLFIDPSCEKLIQDLEKITHDNEDPMLGHISTALGYACWHLSPLKRPRRKATIRTA